MTAVQRASPAPRSVHYQSTGPALVLGGLAAVALLVWLVNKHDLYLGIAAALGVALATDAFFARRAVRDLDVDLVPPPLARAGEPTTWHVRTSGWNRPVVLRPLLIADLDEHLVDDALPGLLSWPAGRRGVMGFVVFDALSSGPLGLLQAGRRIVHHLPEPVCFGPRPLEAEGRWPKPIPTGFGTVEGAPVGDELFRAVRPYRRGDDRRRVDWKTTARHGHLMVRELDGTGQVRVRVVVDLGGPGPAAERVAGLAAWVATTALAGGYEVDLVNLDGRALIPVLADPGRIFKRAPVLGSPSFGPIPTTSAPVRNAFDVARRLATTAYGHPEVPSERRRAGRTCHVSPEGVIWR